MLLHLNINAPNLKKNIKARRHISVPVLHIKSITDVCIIVFSLDI